MKNVSVKTVDLSIIIVTHNRAQRLVQCINSILMCSTFPKEIIIVDDGDMGSLVQEKMTLYNQRHEIHFIYVRVSKPRGVSYSRNLGIQRATGKIVGFVDDDCDVSEDWVVKIWASFVVNPRPVAITGKILPMFPKNYWNQVLSIFHSDRPNVKRRVHFLSGANYFFRSEVFTKYKLRFNELMSICSEDRYISHVLDLHRLQMFYDPTIVVWHDFRRDIIAISKQWFRYGMSDYYFWKYTPTYKSADANYFRRKQSVMRATLSLIRVPRQIYRMIRDLRSSIGKATLYPGLMYIYFIYYMGVYKASLQDTK